MDARIACTFNLDTDGIYLDSVDIPGVCPSGGCTSDNYYGFKIPVLTRSDNYPLDGTTYFFITTSVSDVDVAIGEK